MVEHRFRKAGVEGSIPSVGSEMTFCTYLIKSEKDGSFYTGIASDPIKRLNVHNRGASKTTSRKKPFLLVYVRYHKDYSEARRHEIWLKKKNRDYKNMLADVAQLAPPISGGVK